MARAPRPGTTGNRSATNGQVDETTYEIVVRGEAVRLPLDMLTVRDESLIRRETRKALGEKRSLSGVVTEMQSEDTAGLDAVALLWWLARRKSGEDDLTLSEVLDEFPTFADMERDPDVIAMRVIEPSEDDGEEGGSPEASGAASAPRGRSGPTSSASARGRSKT